MCAPQKQHQTFYFLALIWILFAYGVACSVLPFEESICPWLLMVEPPALKKMATKIRVYADFERRCKIYTPTLWYFLCIGVKIHIKSQAFNSEVVTIASPSVLGASPFTERKGLVTSLNLHRPDMRNVDTTNQITVVKHVHYTVCTIGIKYESRSRTRNFDPFKHLDKSPWSLSKR